MQRKSLLRGTLWIPLPLPPLFLVELHQLDAALAHAPSLLQQLPGISFEGDFSCSIDFGNADVLGLQPLIA